MRIFLIGFMGSGKSYWGKRWAEKYVIPFYDLDEVIEQREQKAILDIFEERGEDIFRMIEAKSLRQLGRHDSCIIACGGGTPCFHENMQWMKEKGTTVYLSASPSFLFNNIMKDKAKRPVIKSVNESELLYFTEQKLKQRLPFYDQADIILNAEELDDNSFEKIRERDTP